MQDPDNHPDTGDPGPDQRIDIHEPEVLERWSQKLGVSPDKLKEAVMVIGDRADALQAHFTGSRQAHGSDHPGGTPRGG